MRLWEKIEYKLSLEWFLVKIFGFLTRRRSSRMDVQKILYPPVYGGTPEKALQQIGIKKNAENV